jgi:hypothetical protein
MKYKWFWLTLAIWFVLGAISSWALIFSPLNFNPEKKAHIEPEINGQKESDDFYVLSNPLQNCLIITTKNWEGEGWKCVTQGANIAPLLFGFQKNDTIFSSYINLSLFQKNDLYRILGLWSDEKDYQTYESVSEFPTSIFSEKNSIDHWDFPFKPPSGAFRPFCFNYDGQQIASWAQPYNGKDEDQFHELFSGQGFTGRLWSRRNEEAVYILQKDSIKLLAVIQYQNTRLTISLMKVTETWTKIPASSD